MYQISWKLSKINSYDQFSEFVVYEVNEDICIVNCTLKSHCTHMYNQLYT